MRNGLISKYSLNDFITCKYFKYNVTLIILDEHIIRNNSYYRRNKILYRVHLAFHYITFFPTVWSSFIFRYFTFFAFQKHNEVIVSKRKMQSTFYRINQHEWKEIPIEGHTPFDNDALSSD